MKKFHYNNLEIQYSVQGQGKTILFLHNGGTSHIIWKDLIEELSHTNQCIALDLIGYGNSSKPKKGFTLDNHLKAITAFINHLELKQITIVGNCMGSAIATSYCVNNISNVHSLILINPLSKTAFLKGRLGFLFKMLQRTPFWAQILFSCLSVIKLNKFMAQESIKIQLGKKGNKNKIHKNPELISCFIPKGQLNSLIWTLKDLESYSFLDSFTPDTTFPSSCIIWGTENKILSPEYGKILSKTIQTSRIEWIEGCGHLLMLEKPTEVTLIIQDFIKNS